MKNILILHLLILFLTINFTHASWRPGEMQVQIEVKHQADIDLILENKLTIDSFHRTKMSLLVTPQELEKLQQLGATIRRVPD